MLVAKINAVKVESVPLNFNFLPVPSGQWAGMPIGLHIAVVAASAPSHMHPHLAVVRELVNRGHRVSYVVSSHLADLAAATGADVVGCTSVLPGAPGAPADWSGDDVAGARLVLDEAIVVLPQVHAALDAVLPDIVLYDIGGMAGPVAADRWGVPAVQISPSMVAVSNGPYCG